MNLFKGILFTAAAVLGIVFFLNFIHCNPVVKFMQGLLPQVAVAPVTMAIEPGSKVEYFKNKVKVTPPKKPGIPGQPATPEPTPREIHHPVELRPWTDKNGILHVEQSGFCLVPLLGGAWSTGDGAQWGQSRSWWQAGARVFVAGQAGLQAAGSDRGWSPQLDLRPFDSNILISAGPEFKGLSFEILGATFSAKFDPGLW